MKENFRPVQGMIMDDYHHHRDFLAVTVHQTKREKSERRDRSRV